MTKHVAESVKIIEESKPVHAMGECAIDGVIDIITPTTAETRMVQVRQFGATFQLLGKMVVIGVIVILLVRKKQQNR